MTSAAPAPAIAPGSPTPSAESLWQDFAAPLRGFLRRRTRNEADADDLLQEVFLRVHRQLPTLRDTSKLQGWVYRIARNVLVDHYRRRPEDQPLPPEAPAAVPDGRDLVDLTPALRRFLAALPAAYREPLVRHEYEGQPLELVAREFGLTLTAAKSRVRRARLMLREMLDGCCRFEFDRRGRVIAATPRRSAPCGC